MNRHNNGVSRKAKQGDQDAEEVDEEDFEPEIQKKQRGDAGESDDEWIELE